MKKQKSFQNNSKTKTPGRLASGFKSKKGDRKLIGEDEHRRMQGNGDCPNVFCQGVFNKGQWVPSSGRMACGRCI